VLLWGPIYIGAERRSENPADWCFVGMSEGFADLLLGIGLILGAAGVFLGVKVRTRLRARGDGAGP